MGIFRADFMNPTLMSPHIWKNTKILHGNDSLLTSKDFTREVETFWENKIETQAEIKSSDLQN